MYNPAEATTTSSLFKILIQTLFYLHIYATAKEAPSPRTREYQKSFQGISSTVAAVWGGYMGVESKNREGVGLINAWGRDTDHGETAVERGEGGGMVSPLLGGGPLRKRDLKKSGRR